MKIIQRLSWGLFNPNQILFCKDDKKGLTVLFFFILSIILMIPNMFLVFTTPIIDYDKELGIRTSFASGEVIPYVIEDGELVYTGIGEELNNYSIQYNEYVFCFSTSDNISYNEESSLASTRIIFKSDGVYYGYSMLSTQIAKYSDNSYFEGLDFSEAKDNNPTFWDSIFAITTDILNKYNPLIRTIEVIAVIFEAIFSILIISLLITIFSRFGSTSIFSFANQWQLVVYFMVPYVIGNVLGGLFNFALFFYLGIVVSLIYSFRINMVSGFGGKENEL